MNSRSATAQRQARGARGTAALLKTLAVAVALALTTVTGPGSSRAQDADPAPPTAPPVAAAPTTAPEDASALAAPASRPADANPRTSPVIAAKARSESQAPPSSLSDLPAWLDYKTRRHIAALPLEARLFHRRGVLLHESGNAEEGARMVRGAAELDPGYIAPHLTLAEWSLLTEPSQALLRYASVVELTRQNFMLQLSLIANLLYAAVQAIFLGLLCTALLIVILRHDQLRHPWIESLSRVIGRGSARLWSWCLMAVPFLLGLGLVLPTLLFLGQLWPQLRARERFVFLTLAAGVLALPLLAGALDRLTLPLDESRAPLYGVALAESEPASPEHTAALAALAGRHPSNPHLQFAAAWAARRSGGLDAAEKLYRHTLELWPNDDRALNNLGCSLMMSGRTDEALALFLEATRANSANAAAWFNQAQVYTQRFDYRAATDALSRASSINFEMVKTYQSQGTEDGSLPLIEQWMPPRRLWQAVTAGQVDGLAHGALPPAWRQRIETRGRAFSAAAFLVAALGIFAGVRMQGGLPQRTCSNCGRVVCRRCCERRRELALCPTCVEAEKRAESPEFARLLLLQVRRRRERIANTARTALATMVPGLGLLWMRRAFSPLIILTGLMSLLGPAFGAVPPFAFEPRLALAPPNLPWQAQAAAWIFLYTWSLLGYFRVLGRERAQAAQMAAPVRSRVTQSTSRTALSDAA